MAYSEHRRAAIRITTTLFAAQSLGSSGIIAAATIASIAGAQISGRSALAGVPASAFQVGAAVAALSWSLASDRLGRRNTLALGLVTGAIGAAGAAAAVVTSNFALLVAAIVVAGSGSAAVKLGRFAAAEAQPPERRGRAVAWVVLGGTVGSVLGPSLVAPAGSFGSHVLGSSLAGPYLVTAAAYGVAALALVTFLRPDPQILGREIEQRYPHPDRQAGPGRGWPQLLRDPGILAAVAAMVIANAVMVMLMGITSLHMKIEGVGLGGISLVFSAHTFGMYAPSIVSGWLADHFGKRPTVAVGGLTLIAGSLAAPLSPHVLPLLVALFLLGLGWNLSFVAGSALLSDRLRPAERGRMQGLNDLSMSGIAASASLGGGLLFAAAGYGATGLIGAVASVLLPLLAVGLGRKGRVHPAT